MTILWRQEIEAKTKGRVRQEENQEYTKEVKGGKVSRREKSASHEKD